VPPLCEGQHTGASVSRDIYILQDRS